MLNAFFMGQGDHQGETVLFCLLALSVAFLSFFFYNERMFLTYQKTRGQSLPISPAGWLAASCHAVGSRVRLESSGDARMTRT